MKYYFVNTNNKRTQSWFTYSPTDNKKKCYQSYYCLDSKQGTILPPSDLIQMCIRHLVKKGKRFEKDDVTEIDVDNCRYYISSEKILLELIKTDSYHPLDSYQYLSSRNKQ